MNRRNCFQYLGRLIGCARPQYFPKKLKSQLKNHSPKVAGTKGNRDRFTKREYTQRSNRFGAQNLQHKLGLRYQKCTERNVQVQPESLTSTTTDVPKCNTSYLNNAMYNHESVVQHKYKVRVHKSVITKCKRITRQEVQHCKNVQSTRGAHRECKM